MDIERLYQDYSIPYMTEGHKHCKEGWVNTACPFCTGNEGVHLGFSIADNYYFCRRCGHHHILDGIASVLGINKHEANTLIKQYGVNLSYKPKLVKNDKVPFELPSDLHKLLPHHKKYLQKRKFDPDYLEELWDLRSSGPMSVLDKISYKHRIIIPFEWDGKIVTFDSRDVTNKHNNKYQACSLEREEIPHKAIVYGKQSEWDEIGICVEGPTDVWRFGPKSFATSGINYKSKQVRVIAKYFKEVAVCFDDETQAIIQANKLIADLKFRGVKAYRVPIKDDPGSMSQSDANSLVKNILKGVFR